MTVSGALRSWMTLDRRRPIEIELAQDQLGVALALLPVVGGLHELHVAADDGERRLEVVDDARQEAPDRREALLALARLARELEHDGRRRVRGDELEELAVLLGERAVA